MSGSSAERSCSPVTARRTTTVEPIRFQGFRDTPLNDTGRAPGRRARPSAIAAEGIASLWSSDLVRAARDRGDRRRAGSGSSRGSTRVCARPTAASGRGGCSSTSRARSPSATPPGCAPGEQFRFPGRRVAARAAGARQRAHRGDPRAAGELPALVVCHGGSIRVMLCRRDPRGLDAFHDFEVPNVAVVPL